MSSSIVKTFHAAPLRLPAFVQRSLWPAAARLSAVLEAAWRGLEPIGQARANRELERLAVRYAHDAALAGQFRAAMHRPAAAAVSARR